LRILSAVIRKNGRRIKTHIAACGISSSNRKAGYLKRKIRIQ